MRIVMANDQFIDSFVASQHRDKLQLENTQVLYQFGTLWNGHLSRIQNLGGTIKCNYS